MEQKLKSNGCVQEMVNSNGIFCMCLDRIPESSSNGKILLVGALEHEFYDFPYIGNIWE